MCNAWNHPPGCTCGFGGDGHLGGGYSYTDLIRIYIDRLRLSEFLINPQIFESYVNPNAICPVCGAMVFFYQSPYGGRVYFDELGPPWPKHPCTDNGDIPRQNKSDRNTIPEWVNHNWQRIDEDILLSGQVIQVNNKIKIEDYLLPTDNDLKTSDFKFFREISDDKFEVIYLNLKTGKIDKLIGHTRLGAIRDNLGLKIPIKVGDEFSVEYRGIDLGFKIQVHPTERQTNLKCFIDKRDLKTESKEKTKIFPHVKFTIMARVTKIKGEVTMIEI
jgi:hypothetical protein